MSRDQRVQDNYALLFAQDVALELKQPLLVIFNLLPGFLGATIRQYDFMIQGLKKVEQELKKLNIPFVLLTGNPVKNINKFINDSAAGVLVSDFDPLRIKKEWKYELKNSIKIPFWEVDTHNIVPCWIVSDKQEYGARTIRPKISKLLDTFLIRIPAVQKHPYTISHNIPEVDWETTVQELTVDHSVQPISWLTSGSNHANETLNIFLREKLHSYADSSNDPLSETESNLSPYLHFGQISSRRIALAILENTGPDTNQESFLEQLIIRKELSDNFCHYNNSYDSIECFPKWAITTLNDHLMDIREYIYSLDQFENSQTHDPLWNACQKEMVIRGKMPNYLRMYWAKKILEWTEHPAQAMEIAIYLNDKYQLDGRDPNGYAGIAWSIGGIHDRAWTERPIFGKIRYMNYNGCKRKFDVKGYISRIDSL